MGDLTKKNGDLTVNQEKLGFTKVEIWGLAWDFIKTKDWTNQNCDFINKYEASGKTREYQRDSSSKDE